MSAAAAHPRRRPARPQPSDVHDSLSDAFQKMAIHKSDTYHPANSESSAFWNGIDAAGVHKSLPRSTTCPTSLEDLVNGPGERIVADLLERVDNAVAQNSKIALESALLDPQILPLTDFAINNDEGAGKTRPPHSRHSRSTDSAIGSSVDEDEDLSSGDIGERCRHCCLVAIDINTDDIVQGESIVDEESTVTRKKSLSAISAATTERGLSQYACEQIHKLVVQPILREETLKEFHPLVNSVPYRIGEKQIKTLRELERTLIRLAPVSGDTRQHRVVCVSWVHLLIRRFWCSGLQPFRQSILPLLPPLAPSPTRNGYDAPRVRSKGSRRPPVYARLLLRVG